MADYDPRYLAGVRLFNEEAFFEAHEVWEGLWLETSGEAKRFYQGLIQAAVCLLHLSNRNYRGAARLYHSARQYMQAYGRHYLGLDIEEFWRKMEATCRPYLESKQPPAEEPAVYPQISLHPEPVSWPAPETFLPGEEES
ncbi:hypothetical protein HRbin36_00712 [bacterium HR36]|nr:hypothetical protein HRbin36_00712 [bacterium HR36]